MKNWQKKRQADRKAQKSYWHEHKYCEICLFEGRGKVRAVEIHEILYKSQMGKCVDENMISVCRPDHQRAHFLIEPYLHREDLYKMKEKIKKSIRICPKCGAFKYLRDCSCGWKLDKLEDNDILEVQDE